MLPVRWNREAAAPIRRSPSCGRSRKVSLHTVMSRIGGGGPTLPRDPVWVPDEDVARTSRLDDFMRKHGFGSYHDLWVWSVNDLDAFWASVWEYFEVEGSFERVL